MAQKYDFSGWATKNDLRCSDGRTIRRDAFKHCDGAKVPLVWNHQHDQAKNVLGHALLENRSEGVYAYCNFNDTEQGKIGKMLVQHGDITGLSIYANKLRENRGDVLHGDIKEVSLVLAGANPGALIDSVMIHSDGSGDEAIIYTDEEIIVHSADDDDEEDEKKEEEVEESEEDTDNEAKANDLEAVKPEAKQVKKKKDEDSDEPAVVRHSDDDKTANADEGGKDQPMAEETTSKKEEKGGKTIKDVLDTFNEDQKNVLYALVGMALEDKDAENKDDKDDKEMKHNVFDSDATEMENVLSHSDMVGILEDAKRCGSLKEAVLQHGITNIDVLFPDAKAVNNPPEWLMRDQDWVSKVMNGTHHTPFSRIKSTYADLTEDEARAKGYIKGNEKKEEFFKAYKRTTTPTTVYKKQKIDRDDVVDITDFDVVNWLKQEMRVMLNEELARAYLIGDGRLSSSEDHIDDTCIRPVWTDDDVYTIKYTITDNTDPAVNAKAFIKAAVRSRKNYKGTGNPTLFCTEDMLTEMLLLEDTMGHILYDSEAKLAAAMRVKEIVTVPVMENQTRDVDGVTHTLGGIIVNLADYNVGADKGGAVSMFDDFDIDYNRQKYLIETRCSGALVLPYSAIAIEFAPAA